MIVCCIEQGNHVSSVPYVSNCNIFNFLFISALCSKTLCNGNHLYHVVQRFITNEYDPGSTSLYSVKTFFTHCSACCRPWKFEHNAIGFMSLLLRDDHPLPSPAVLFFVKSLNHDSLLVRKVGAPTQLPLSIHTRALNTESLTDRPSHAFILVHYIERIYFA